MSKNVDYIFAVDFNQNVLIKFVTRDLKVNVIEGICVLDEERAALFHEHAITVGNRAREKKGTNPRVPREIPPWDPKNRLRRIERGTRYAVSFIVRRSFVRGDMAAPPEDPAGTGESRSPGLMKW